MDVLLELKIIQPSRSQCSSPVVMARKSDGSYRMTIDYRALNLFEEDLHQFADAKYFSELDLSRAYYQIHSPKTLVYILHFPLDMALWNSLNYLPFDLVNACSACAQLMRIVLRGLENVTFYFDNIYVYGKTFEAHSVVLEHCSS